jgi:hypothetical protein
MSEQPNPANSNGNGGYERSDLRARGILYFLGGLAASVLLVYFIVGGLYSFLDKRSEKEQAPVSQLVNNAPTDTRHIPPNYEEKAFPAPRLENDERGQLNDIRLKEEQTLSTYDYIDQKAGTVRIPIERAMDLVAQRGLPVRSQSAATAAPAEKAQSQPPKKKGTKK